MSVNDEVFVRSVERHEIRFAIPFVRCVELLDEVHGKQFTACHLRLIRKSGDADHQAAENQQDGNKLLYRETPFVYQSKRQLEPRIKEMQKRIKSFEQ